MRHDYASATESPMLIPLPSRCRRTGEPYRIDAQTRYRVSGVDSRRVVAAACRFAKWVRDATGIDLPLEAVSDSPAGIRIHVEESSSSYPSIADDESYRLTVGETGIEILAPKLAGVLHALTTVRQMIIDREWSPVHGELSGVEVEDRPRFAWRGLMIDTSRHFIPVEVILRNLDAMAWGKLNVLHLHLSDDQGFRVESREFPELHGRGSDGDYYTHAEIREIVNYAAARRIRVIPEFDLPGHASSWLVGYPHLGCRPDHVYALADDWGHHDVCLNPASEEVYDFLDRFFREVLPLFPDEIVHIGGDEVTGEEWLATPDIVEFMATNGIHDVGALQARFNARVRDIVGRLGKRIMGWDEVVHPLVATDAVVQSWRGLDSVETITGAGHECVQSHGYYLNTLQSSRDYYLADPVPMGLPEDQARLVLGGEACMWTEYVDATNIDTRIWPRAMAVAERLWSSWEVRDVRSLTRRMLCQDLWRRKRRQLLLRWLRRRGGRRECASLMSVVEQLRPVPQDAAIAQRDLDRHTRLDRLVDALPVESENLFFNTESGPVRVWLASIQFAEADRFRLYRLVVDCDYVEQEFKGTEILADLAPLLVGLRDLARIGISAIDQGDSKTRAWIAAQLQRIDESAVVHGGVEINIVEPIRDLVRATGPATR